jgi:GNAT superfamily N-acetyltransferase
MKSRSPLRVAPSAGVMPLSSRHREALLAHLLSLGDEDRSDRFMGHVDDDYVRLYVDGIGLSRDVLVGALKGQRVIAVAHAAVYVEHGERVSEVGLSVDAGMRRRGLGRHLLLAAIKAAQCFNVRRVVVIFRSANAAMAGLTRSLGARIERHAGEASAVFELDAGPRIPSPPGRQRRRARRIPACASRSSAFVTT